MNSYLRKYAKECERFIEVCHNLSSLMFVTGHGGNAARKLEENIILITPTKMNKGEIQTSDLVFVDGQGRKIEGQRNPTGEIPMYLGIFEKRPDINAALHCHPPYTNAFAIANTKNWLMSPIFPETITEVGPVPLVPYAEPLTQTLADNFLPYLELYNAFLMENHGLVITTTLDISWCMMMTELLEMTSLSLIQAAILGDIKEISPEDLLNLDNVMKKRGLPMFGAPGKNRSLMDVYYPDKAAKEVIFSR